MRVVPDLDKSGAPAHLAASHRRAYRASCTAPRECTPRVVVPSEGSGGGLVDC